MALRIYSWRVVHTTKSGSSVTDAGTGWLSHEGAASRPYHNAQFGTQQQINSILLHWVVGTWLWWFVSHEGRQANHKLPHLIALQDTMPRAQQQQGEFHAHGHQQNRGAGMKGAYARACACVVGGVPFYR